MMKICDIKLRAQAVVLLKEGYSYSTIVWGSQEGNVLRANQMKLSPSVMMSGGMMGHGLTDLRFVMQEIQINSDYYIDNILDKNREASL